MVWLAEHVQGRTNTLLQDLVGQRLLLVRGLGEKPLQAGSGRAQNIVLLPLKVFEIDGYDLGLNLDSVEVEPRGQDRGVLPVLFWPTTCFVRITPAILGLLRSKVRLLTIPEEIGQARVRHDVAKHLKALADELRALSHVWVEHVEVTDVLVTYVTRARSHSWAAEQPLDEAPAIAFHEASEAGLLGLRQGLHSGWVEAVKSLRTPTTRSEDLQGAEAARSEGLVRPPLSLALGLVRHLEVLGREELVWVLRVGVGIVVLILGDVVALELHVLLRARGGTLNPCLPSASWVWLRSLVEALGLYLKNFQKQLCDTQKRGNRTPARFSSEVHLDTLSDLVLQSKSQGVHVGDEQLDPRVAASEAGKDEAREALDFLPDVGTPGDLLASSLPSGRGSRAVRHTIGQRSHRRPSSGSNSLDELHGDLPGGGLEAVEILEDFGHKPVTELAIFLLL